MGITDAELGWLAGIFEGEGCITYRQPTRHEWALRVVMSDEDVVRRFHRLIGVGNVTGPYVYNGGKPLWAWRAAAVADVLNAVRMLEPLMGDRRAARMRDCVYDLIG
jgi:hypothetical protein